MDAPLQKPLPDAFLTALQENADSQRAFHSQRAFRRFSVNLTVNVGGDKPFTRSTASAKSSAAAKSSATLANASVSGFCFSSLEEFSQDTIIVIEIEMNRQIHRVPALVRRCDAQKKLGRTFYECGAQYVKSEATFLFLPLMASYLRLQAPEF